LVALGGWALFVGVAIATLDNVYVISNASDARHGGRRDDIGVSLATADEVS
jgi:hypothetical protein